MEMAAKNMTWYEEMKKRLLFYTATVGIVGTGLAYGSLGAASATAFASGSALSFAYQVSLQKKVDNIGSKIGGGDEGAENSMGLSIATGALPFFGVSVLAWIVYSHPDLLDANDLSRNDNFRYA